MNVPLYLCLIITIGTTVLLYQQTQRLFRQSLDERMTALAAAAASQFDPAVLDNIHGPESVKTDSYRQVVAQLQWLRKHVAKVKYAYIMRPTDQPDTLAFVADADSLDPSAKIDLNGDGIIDAEDALTWPGDPYDVSAFPAFQKAAFVAPFVDPEISHDQWGSFLSGTAPIQNPRDPSAPAHYAIGLDVDVSDYETFVNSAFIPFFIFIVALLSIITILALLLKRMWRVQVNQLAEIDRQKDELLGIVAHQLRNPITAVKFSMESILDGDFGEVSTDAVQQLKEVEEKTKGLSELADLLVDVSKIELGKLAMNLSDVDLRPLFDEIVTIILPQAELKKTNFIRNIGADLGHARIDKRLTHMTIENLLSNAVKYTPEEGRVELTILRQGDTLSITVQDTGMGIPKADQDRIFGKLYRATNVGSVDGNGFGLYVAKGAIEQQGGRIWFESEEGKGTTFHVELPLSLK